MWEHRAVKVTDLHAAPALTPRAVLPSNLICSGSTLILSVQGSEGLSVVTSSFGYVAVAGDPSAQGPYNH